MFEFKIWKEPMLVLKQMIHQKKALMFSFKNDTLKVNVALKYLDF